MSPTIEVSAEVFAHLQKEAVPLEDTADTVLRRLLSITAPAPQPATATPAPHNPKPSTGKQPAAPAPRGEDASRRPGALAPLIDAGLLRAGDRLYRQMHGPSKKVHAVVEPDGWIRLTRTGDVFANPSAAANFLKPQSGNGWLKWRHSRDGALLAELRGRITTDTHTTGAPDTTSSATDRTGPGAVANPVFSHPDQA